MTEYQDGNKSIPISGLSREEAKKAFTEFAEGNPHAYSLFMACYDHGVETSGSHIGASPYLDVKVNNSHDEIKKMIHSVQEVDGIQIFICPDGGFNPNAGEIWDEPLFDFGFMKTTDEKSANNIFDAMSESLNNGHTTELSDGGAFDAMLDFYDFFVGKDSGLMIRATCDSGQYYFSIEAHKKDRNSNYFADLFQKSGLTFIEATEDSPHNVWEITAATPEEFRKRVMACMDIIANEWSLESPDEITDDMPWNVQSHILKRKFGAESPEYKKWLEAKIQEIEENERASNEEPVVDLGSIEDATKEVTTTDMQNAKAAMQTYSDKELGEGQPTISE